MKKLICLFAFIGFGYVAVNAQNAAPAPAPVPVEAAVEAPKSDKATDVKAEKKSDKKECAPAEKKSCATRSCCSKKHGEAKIEDKKETKMNP